MPSAITGRKAGFEPWRHQDIARAADDRRAGRGLAKSAEFVALCRFGDSIEGVVACPANGVDASAEGLGSTGQMDHELISNEAYRQPPEDDAECFVVFEAICRRNMTRMNNF